jgi:hypothetical protein
MKFTPLVVLFAALTTSCGGGVADPPRQLVSITVTPAIADAQNFPNGQVQFTATGTFSDGSKSQITTLWTLNGPFTETAIPNIMLNSSGMAQCVAGGFVGTGGVFATAPADTNIPLSQMTMLTKNVSGTAQITCP